ncbi:Putative 115 kDa protein in type-1 retrotransposable element R1DM [Eumeta japonica]|uniref:115 kDa protein in type-1 retrotransposable element R1DM n=1 Tax=Eumeta variegata TaxID=151549 RepID=A0A4C1YTF9_EUMVA|nr:Putative 115 kDa protein in type-1 retrotransposable element R1DM [Eumeta japonica]
METGDAPTEVDTKTILMIQANLQRSKVATAELLQLATEKGISIALVQEPYVGNQGILKQNPGTKVIQCTVGRQKPVKAAIIVFGDKVEVLHDPQLVTETESAVLLKIGRMKLGIISIYFEGDEDIEPYIIRTKKACKNLGTENLIIAGDINAWSHWWGSQREDRRGQAYRDFLDEMGFHILNTGSTPTFETYRGDRICSSIVDVTTPNR